LVHIGQAARERSGNVLEIFVEELDAVEAVAGGAGELVRQGMPGGGAAEGHGCYGGFVFVFWHFGGLVLELRWLRGGIIQEEDRKNVGLW